MATGRPTPVLGLREPQNWQPEGVSGAAKRPPDDSEYFQNIAWRTHEKAAKITKKILILRSPKQIKKPRFSFLQCKENGFLRVRLPNWFRSLSVHPGFKTPPGMTAMQPKACSTEVLEWVRRRP